MIVKQISEEQFHSLLKEIATRVVNETKNQKIKQQLQEQVDKIVEESLDELNQQTLFNAYSKMNALGQINRAEQLSNNSYKVIYETDSIKISTEINILKVQDGTELYSYVFSKDSWTGNSMPRFNDRRAAVIIANTIHTENPESGYGNKSLYIA